MFYVAGWLSSSGLIQTTINFKAELCWLVWCSTETPCTVDNQLKNAADQQSPFHHANCARHRLSKRGCGLNMWAWCTSCFPPNPISDKTLNGPIFKGKSVGLHEAKYTLSCQFTTSTFRKCIGTPWVGNNNVSHIHLVCR